MNLLVYEPIPIFLNTILRNIGIGSLSFIEFIQWICQNIFPIYSYLIELKNRAKKKYANWMLSSLFLRFLLL